VAALNAVIQPHTVAKADIWKAREVNLSPDEKAHAGRRRHLGFGRRSPRMYPNQLFVDPEKSLIITSGPNKAYEVDAHGLAFDLHSNRVHGELYPLGDNATDCRN
jgi:hypothetical protein